MDDYSRDPCPWRIVDDAGSGFLAGAIGGSVFHSIIGFRNAPKGLRNKMLSSFSLIKERSPITARYCAAFGILYTTIDFSLVHIRQRQDPWNSIISGALSGAITAARYGVPVMAIRAIMFGTFFAITEGALLMLSRRDLPHVYEE